MSNEFLDRPTILNQLRKIIEIQENIADYIHKRLCLDCDELADDMWVERRKDAFKKIRNLIDKYSFSKNLPRDDLGIMAQAIVSHLLNIQHTFLRVLVMIDMLKDESFNEIFMDSMTTISKKVHEMMVSLNVMISQRESAPEDAEETLELLLKLERQIDEDNIVICRQISIATGGDSDYTCYMMRKIVADLEHISDYAKECAEIIAEI